VKGNSTECASNENNKKMATKTLCVDNKKEKESERKISNHEAKSTVIKDTDNNVLVNVEDKMDAQATNDVVPIIDGMEIVVNSNAESEMNKQDKISVSYKKLLQEE